MVFETVPFISQKSNPSKFKLLGESAFCSLFLYLIIRRFSSIYRKDNLVIGNRDMDTTLFEMINSLAGKFPALDAVMLFSAKYLLVVFAITLVIFYLTFWANQQRIAFLAGVSTLIALGVAQGIAYLFSRPRPYLDHAAHLLIAQPKDPSFPSDHATFCCAIAMMIWLHNRKVGGILLALAVLVGFSRVYVGTHYPTDILGGAALGIGISILINYIAKQNSVRTLLDRLFMKLHKWHLAAKPEQRINLRSSVKR